MTDLEDVYDPATLRAIERGGPEPRRAPVRAGGVRGTVAAGAVVAAGLAGVREALEDDDEAETAEVRLDPGLDADAAVTVLFVPGQPEATVAVVRPCCCPHRGRHRARSGEPAESGSPGLSHPLRSIRPMEPILLIVIIVALAVAAGAGVAGGLHLARSRREAEGTAVARLAEQLAAQHDARMEGMVDGVVERVVTVAGESFDSRLRTGTAELEHRREAISREVTGVRDRVDERLGDVVARLEAKVDSVDRLVAEKVGGLSDTVGERVGGMSKDLGHQVTAIGTELHQLRGLVGQLQKERAQQHGQLVESLEAATRQQKLLSETTQHLREALASPQSRGQWGERMAEDVLRAAGMREGINYRRQRSTEVGTKPDFTFLLPDDRLLHMDVKFPVTNYLRHLEAPSDTEAAALRDRFLRDVRERMKELQSRGYAATDTTVGYLLLFIPNESVYGFIHEHDAALLDDALAQKVVLCSPTTLFAVLGVIRQAMDTFAVERATEEILDCLASFGEQWERFSAQIDKVDKHLGTLNNSFTDLSGPRRRQLERQLLRIDEVRARTGVEGADAPVLGELEGPRLRDVSAG